MRFCVLLCLIGVVSVVGVCGELPAAFSYRRRREERKRGHAGMTRSCADFNICITLLNLIATL